MGHHMDIISTTITSFSILPLLSVSLECLVPHFSESFYPEVPFNLSINSFPLEACLPSSQHPCLPSSQEASSQLGLLGLLRLLLACMLRLVRLLLLLLGLLLLLLRQGCYFG